jgi:hypothetical protein
MTSSWEDYVRRANRLGGMEGLHLEPKFAGTYGPLLATLRARFLRDAHPAWGVVGNWLRPQLECHQTCVQVILPLLLSGVFFSDYDPVPLMMKKWMGGLFQTKHRSGMTPIKSLYLEPHFNRIKKAYYHHAKEIEVDGHRVWDFLRLIPNKRREQEVLYDVHFSLQSLGGFSLLVVQGLGGSF